jgi:zinc transporter ZupT
MSALIAYSVIALVATLLGSLIPLIQAKWADRQKWRLLAFSSGVLLGIAILHLFPETWEHAGKSGSITILITFGILFAAENMTSHHAGHDFLHHATGEMVPLAALLALTLHAVVDGMAMGISLRGNLAFGSAISVGVILHKFVDGLTRTSLLHAAKYYQLKEISLSVLLATATPIGAFLTYMSAAHLNPHTIGILLGVSTGSFIYVGAADLLPRLHESNDRHNLMFFLIGLIVVSAFPG